MHCGVMVTGYNQADWPRLMAGEYDRPPEIPDPVQFDATLELWVASRTDDELREHLLSVEREVATAIGKAAESALGDLARRPGFADDLAYALATIRGLALLQVSNGASSRSLARLWRHTRTHLLELLS